MSLSGAPRKPRAVLTWLVLGLCVLIHLGLSALQPGEAGAPFWLVLSAPLLEACGALGPAHSGLSESWRYLAYAFLHHDTVHLGLNVLALLWIGGALERRLGAVALASVFVVAALGGAVGAGSVGSSVVGVSGAVCGLLAALGLWAADGSSRVRVLSSLGLILGLGLAWNHWGAAGVGVGVSNAAHVGGAVAGAVAAWLWRRRTLRWALATTAIGVGAALLGHGIWSLSQTVTGAGLRYALSFDPAAAQRRLFPELGVAFSIPPDWKAKRLKGSWLELSSPRGLAQIRLGRSNGGFDPYASPDTIVSEHQRSDANTIAAPFTQRRVGGVDATVIELVSLRFGQSAQWVHVIVPMANRSYHFVFLAQYPYALDMADRVLRSVDFQLEEP